MTHPSAGMLPTIGYDDWILVFPASDIRRGDLVVFKHPTMPKLQHVKRVIGMPTERIEWAGGLIVNGTKASRTRLEERPELPTTKEDLGDPYFYREQVAGLSLTILDDESIQRDVNAIYLPEDAYYVLGDFRSNSVDSRMFGAIPRSSIVGKVFRLPWSSGLN